MLKKIFMFFLIISWVGLFVYFVLTMLASLRINFIRYGYDLGVKDTIENFIKNSANCSIVTLYKNDQGTGQIKYDFIDTACLTKAQPMPQPQSTGNNNK